MEAQQHSKGINMMFKIYRKNGAFICYQQAENAGQAVAFARFYHRGVSYAKPV